MRRDLPDPKRSQAPSERPQGPNSATPTRTGVRWIHATARVVATVLALALLTVFTIGFLMSLSDEPRALALATLRAHPFTVLLFFGAVALVYAAILTVLLCAIKPTGLGQILPWRHAQSERTGLVIVYGFLACAAIYQVLYLRWEAQALRTIQQPLAPTAPRTQQPTR